MGAPAIVGKVIAFPVKKTYKRSSSGYTAQGKRVAHAADAIPPEVLQEIKSYFLDSGKTRNGLRNWTLLALGINVGCRCGDLGKLRVGDVLDSNGDVKTEVEYVAQKTRTWEMMYIQDELKPLLVEYIATLKDKSNKAWLFPTERGTAMNTDAVYKMFVKVAKDLNLDFHFTTHSMRKTLGRNAYEVYGMDGARELLRHRDNKSTAHYIGVTEERIRDKALGLPVLGG